MHVDPAGRELDINPFTQWSEIHTGLMKTEMLKQAFGSADSTSRSEAPAAKRSSRGGGTDLFVSRCAACLGARRTSGGMVATVQRPQGNWTELDVWLYIHLRQVPIVLRSLAAGVPSSSGTRRCCWSTTSGCRSSRASSQNDDVRMAGRVIESQVELVAGGAWVGMFDCSSRASTSGSFGAPSATQL